MEGNFVGVKILEECTKVFFMEKKTHGACTGGSKSLRPGRCNNQIQLRTSENGVRDPASIL